MWDWFLHQRKFYWSIHCYRIYLFYCHFIYLTIKYLPLFLYLWCLNNCESCIINLILIQYFFQTQVTHLFKIRWEICCWDHQSSWEIPINFQFFVVLDKYFGCWNRCIFSDLLMCPTSFLGILNPIASTNNFTSSIFSATFPISIPLSNCMRCYYTIVLYLLILVLLKLLVFSVGTITISLSSKICRSLLISWSFSFFSVV